MILTPKNFSFHSNSINVERLKWGIMRSRVKNDQVQCGMTMNRTLTANVSDNFYSFNRSNTVVLYIYLHFRLFYSRFCDSLQKEPEWNLEKFCWKVDIGGVVAFYRDETLLANGLLCFVFFGAVHLLENSCCVLPGKSGEEETQKTLLLVDVILKVEETGFHVARIVIFPN